jgi:hypothetical protein
MPTNPGDISRSGVLNKAFYQLSGKYKIYVSSRKDNYKMYLSDYTNYKVEFDITSAFMPQLAKFLRTQTLVDTNKLAYGAYQSLVHNGQSPHPQKTYHIPYYIGLDASPTVYPDYAVILKAPNKDIIFGNRYQIFSESLTLDIIDLQHLGIYNIFDEIIDLRFHDSIMLRYPVDLIWNTYKNHQIVLNGYNYDTESVVHVPINITDYVINQIERDDTINFLTSIILENFEKNHIIFPRFINFEFAFDYDYSLGKDFNNFFAYLSYQEIISDRTPANPAPLLQMTDEKNVIILEDTISSFQHPVEFRDINQFDYPLITVERTVSEIMIQDINEQPEQTTFKIYSIFTNQILKFVDENGNIIIEYYVSASDIKPTLLQTCIHVFNRISYISNDLIQPTCTYVQQNIIQVKIIYSMPLTLELYNASVMTARYESNSIKLTDVELLSHPDMLNNVSNLELNGVSYKILKTFSFNQRTILRLDNNPQITEATQILLLQYVKERYVKLYPVSYNTYIDQIVIQPKFDIHSYGRELVSTLGNTPTFPYDPNLYISFQYSDLISDLFTTDKVRFPDLYFKQSNVPALMQHTLNYDSNTFGINNFCTDKTNNFFLIQLHDNNSLRPAYISVDDKDLRSLRYCENPNNPNPKYPHIRSYVFKIDDYNCQSIFLGTSYILPVKFDKYSFSVVWDYDNLHDTEHPRYYILVDHANMTIDLYINYYFPFMFIRNAPKSMIDPSIFDLPSTFYIDQSKSEDSLKLESQNNFGILFGTNITSDISKKIFNQLMQRTDYLPALYCDHFLLLQSTTNPYPTSDCFMVHRTNTVYTFPDLFGGQTDIVLTYPITVQYFDTDGIIRIRDINILKITLKDIIIMENDFVICKDIIPQIYPDGFFWLKNVDGHQGKFLKFITTVDIGNAYSNMVLGEKYVYLFDQFTDEDSTTEKIDPPNDKTNNPLYKWASLYTFIKDPSSFFSPYQQSSQTGMYLDIPVADLFDPVNIPSLRDQWFRVWYSKRTEIDNPQIDTSTDSDLTRILNNNIPTYRQEVAAVAKTINDYFAGVAYPNTYVYEQYFIDRFNELPDQNAQYGFDFIDYNTFWHDIMMLSRGLKTTNQTIQSVKTIFSYISFDYFSDFLNNNMIQIWDKDGFTDESVYIRTTDMDVNTNADNKKIYRYSTSYEPHFVKTDIHGFLKTVDTPARPNIIKTIYSENFAGSKVSVTGLYDTLKQYQHAEYNGQLISGCFCGDDVITLTTPFQTTIDLSTLLADSYDINKCIIGNNNYKYLSKITINPNQYIVQEYCKYLLRYQYKPVKVVQQNKSIMFDYDINTFILKPEISKSLVGVLNITLQRI